jgi:hypothetical protein
LFEAESGAEEAPDVDFDFSGRGVETEWETTNTQIDDALNVIDALEE